jgi:hypothetical protein
VRAAGFAIGIAALAVVLWALAGHPLVNYDSLYALDWGRDLAHGHAPDYNVALAPTPHPLWTLLGAVLSPLSSATTSGVHGPAAQTALLVIAMTSLALLGWVVYALGSAWFGRAAGVLAALIILTRRPVIDFGARAYMDIPYLVLVLGALLAETRRPKCGWPVLALLAVAGLIRPEAWLFAAVYWIYLWRTTGSAAWRLAPLAAAGPLLWGLSDLLITGDPLSSLTGTRDTAETLHRVRGLQHVPTIVPRRIGEIVRIPVLLGAAGGGIMALLWLRERAKLGVIVGVLSIVAFCVLAVAGLPIIGRYLLLPATILVIFAGAGAFGWLCLKRGDPHRRIWAWFAVVVFAALIVYTPAQVSMLRAERHALVRQGQIERDLRRLAATPGAAIDTSCLPVAVPNHRAVPLLALWLNTAPQRIVSAEQRPITAGTYVAPATAAVAHDYILDPNDPQKTVPRVPAGFRAAGANASWRVYKSC